MDSVEIERENSLRRSRSSNRWRDTTMDVFSKSSRSRRDEENEEDLKWAAIERLPTFSRTKKGILYDEDGQSREIDVTSLGLVERKNLLDRLVKIAEDDNEKFLLKLKNRIDRVSLDIPTIEVRFEHLNVQAEAYVGSRALPTMLNSFANVIEGILSSVRILPSKRQKLKILHEANGIIKPRRLTLLLGPPGSGKTTLLLALAGKLDKGLKASGEVTYNGYTMKEFVPQRSSAYISQYDVHIGEMTVRETLQFSAQCQGVGSRYQMLEELSRREKAANIKPDHDLDIYMKAAAVSGHETNVVTDYMLKILGLDVCADTMIGDEMLRGISGGQRKRVTTGEMLVGPERALFMDEISTGLDSSTTFQIVNCLRQSIHILNGTAVICLLQPAPETFNLFDDIILLSEGQIVYQGPRENVLEFFEHMGFKCPERKGVADFLQEVTSRKDQEQYWTHEDQPYRFITSSQFAEAFQVFHVGKELGDELASPFDKSKAHPAALTTKKYGVDRMDIFKACISREYLLMKRNSFVYFFKLFQLAFMALVTMTVFFRTEMHRETLLDGGLYMSISFFAITNLMFNGFSELPMTIMKLPVFYKQRDLRFYPSWAYALPAWILKIPVTFVEVAVWSVITYYAIGFDPSIERFLKHFLILLMTAQMASGMFRLMGAVGRNMVVGNTLAAFSMVAVLVLGGFMVSRDNIKKWWIWGYWISPLMYAQNAASVNELLGKSWGKVLLNTTEPLGVMALRSHGVFPEARWYWIGVGALIGYILLFNLLFSLALRYLNSLDKPKAILSKEILAEKEASRTKTSIELSSTTTSSSARDSQKDKRRKSAFPFVPHCLTFDEVRYSVDMPQEMKAQGVQEDKLLLLKGISGTFRPGVLTALMGVSGAGKTTLMDVLAGRKTGGYIEGALKVSGYPKKQKTFTRIAGYCEQNDIHSPNVTVYESLLFSAWMRLPRGVDSNARKVFVEEVMELVELTSLRKALVGLPGVNGLSTEQRKRLTIAVELVANPSIIFMDEPTSGLDARAAAIVMRTVRNTVDTGRTVVCTIHQPSIDIFDAFDELQLLKRGGEEIYVGPLGRHAVHLISYFEGINGVPKIKDGYNPATWMLEVTSQAQELALGVDFANIYKDSELYRSNKTLIEELSRPSSGSKDIHFSTRFSQSSLTQFMACLWKQHWSYWRNPSYTSVRILFTTIIALIFGSIFWGLGSKRKTEQDILTALGSMFAAVMFIGVQNAAMVQPVVSIERTVFYREKGAGMYSALPYAIGQVTIELPYVFVQTIIYEVIIYAMIGFEWTVSKFAWYFYFMYLTFLYFTYYGMMVVAATPNQQVASTISSAFYNLWTLFGGFYVPRSRIPIWWRWYTWFCPVAWTLNGLVTSQFGDIRDKFESGEIASDFINTYFGYRDDLFGVVAAVVFGFAVCFAFIFAYSIKMFNFQTR